MRDCTGKADEDTLEQYRLCQARGMFDDELPEEKVWYWRGYAEANLVEYVYPLLERALAENDINLNVKNLDLCQDATSVRSGSDYMLSFESNTVHDPLARPLPYLVTRCMPAPSSCRASRHSTIPAIGWIVV